MRGALLAASMFVATAAVAEDAAVEALIQRGIQLRRDSADEEALAVFQEAEKQDPTSVRVLLHVVTAAQGAGKWLLADAYMRKVSALTDDPYYRRHAEAIDVVRRTIATRVGSLQVQGGPDGATVRLDGRLVGTLPMTEPASIEGGAYLMEVHKPGYYRLRRNVTITGGVLTREPVELNRAVARTDFGAGSGAGDGANQGEVGAEPKDKSWLTSPALGWSLVGLGVASGITSGIAFVTREDRVERWNDEDQCVPDDGSSRESACSDFKRQADTAQTVGIVTGVAGAVLIGAGITQLLTTQGSGSGETAHVPTGFRVAGCDPGLMSVACYGSF